MKKIVRKMIPDESIIQPYLGNSSLAKRIQSSRCLQVNLRSVSRGVAIGLFFAFLPLPLQMFLSAITAATFRGNILIAMAMTWITNPFTFLPINYLIFSIGHFITRNEETYHTIASIHLHDISSPHPIEQLQIWANQAGMSYLVGLPVTAISFACTGYLLVQLIWRGYIAYRLHNRRR